ncbi:MAG: helix-turn-helix domain-containing protein, partial [Psychrosphaera sp.]|nr:helix-turn-helix domain-containing protein [Psychrosphaera sp.]
MRYWPISLLILSFCSFANDMATQQNAINMFSYVVLTSVCLFLLMRTRNLHLQSAQRSSQLKSQTDTLENLKNQSKTLPESDQSAAITQQNDVELQMSLKDRLFVERFEAIIAKNYQLNTFNRSQTASQMAISERQLNRKLGLLTDDNFSCYLRKYRLTQAVCLMGKGLQVSQIGDRIGFSS